MGKSNMVDIASCRRLRESYRIGLVLGAVRAEIDAGTLTLADVYSLLSERSRNAISGDIARAGGEP